MAAVAHGKAGGGEQSGTSLKTSPTWLTLRTNSALTYMGVAFVTAVLQTGGTQKLKRAPDLSFILCNLFSYCICWISLQGSFLIRSHANLPLTPTLWQTCTQRAIYSPSYIHSCNYHRAFLCVSSLFLQAPAELCLRYPEEDSPNAMEDHHPTTVEA